MMTEESGSREGDGPLTPSRLAPAEVALTGLAILTPLVAGAGAAMTLDDATAGLWGLVAALVVILAVRARDRWLPALVKHGYECGRAVDELVARRPGPCIALAAAAGIGGELFLIRWQASTFQLFSYFKNVSLLAAFLGLGLGYALARSRPLVVSMAVPALALQVVVLRALGASPIQSRLQSPISEHLALGLVSQATAGHWLLTYGIMVGVFLLTVLTCLPLGQLAGRALEHMPPLRGYAWNLTGSLVAVAAFTVLAEAWTPPSVWLLAVVASLVPFLAALPGASFRLGLAWVGLALVVLAVPSVDTVDFFSPYQLVTLRLRPVAPFIESSHAYFQQIWDLRPGLPRVGELGKVAAHYELPYAFSPATARVLVVGSGAGNDVAAALRAGARAVDAVEIDPVIVALGRQLHPEQPYADPRVRVFVEDARSFVRHTDARYDLIVYGLLDSHTVVSGASSVRLDSYVYTVEAIREARSLLSDRGVLAMSFTLLSREIALKLYLMLREAFEESPLVYSTLYDGGLTFVAGPGLRRSALPALPLADVSKGLREARFRPDLPTDDWPFLYMPRRRFPVSYLVMAGILAGVTLLVLGAALPGAGGRFSLAAFGLGAGFMLLETKGITDLALVYGSTWQVTSAVIAGVLVMALAANAWVAHRGHAPVLLVYGLIAASIAAGLVVAPAGWGISRPAERILATALATLPLLFSGAAFSAELARARDSTAILASNLLGAMVGGLLEYNVLYLGVRRLGVMALALYAVAFIGALRKSRAS
jgi:hypothetical protein